MPFGNDEDCVLLARPKIGAADASAVFRDYSDGGNGGAGHALSAVGNTQVDTAQFKFLGRSILLDGSGDVLALAAHADFDLSAGLCGIDFWMRPIDTCTNAYRLISLRNPSTSAWYVNIYVYQSRVVIEYRDPSNGGHSISSSVLSWTPYAWYHIAAMMDGTYGYLYRNGVYLAHDTLYSIASATPICNIGGSAYEGFCFPGHMAEVRMVNSACPIFKTGDPIQISSGIYSDGFTPPLGPYGIVRAATPGRMSARATTSARTPARIDTIRVTRYAQTAARLDALRDTIRASTPARLDSRSVTRSRAVARMDFRARQHARAAARLSFRAKQNAQTPARIDFRATARNTAPARLDARAKAYASQPGRLNVLCLPGWRVVLRNIDTGAETEIGFIDESASPKTASIATPADGVYAIEARPWKHFWEDCRGPLSQTIEISGGEIIWSSLPAVENLQSEVISGTTLIRWNVAAGYSDPEDFGLWFGGASPVDTSGDPDETVTFESGAGEYRFRRTQTAAEYVAVRSRSDTDAGPTAELYLPWSAAAPDAPALQHATPIGA